jgi:23S rRNA (adenine2503-C2)-methyltransferase
MRVTPIQSSDQNVSKYVFEWPDAVAEAVLYKYPTYEERTVICCSAQSGCPVGCRFCGSGDYFVRNLTAEEIITQPMRLLQDTGVAAYAIRKLQIMFMSMGEPMLNLNAVMTAIECLHNIYPQADLLISTTVPRVDYDAFLRLSERIPNVGLQFSLHESTDEARNELIPFKAKATLKEIAILGKNWYWATDRRKPFINYCVHDGNNTDADADRLRTLFNPLLFNATLSVVCERDEHVAAANQRQVQLAADFSQKLIKRGFNVRVFNPAGQDDIGGGCGQLWFVQDWMRQHPDKARASAGNGLVKLHTPR